MRHPNYNHLLYFWATVREGGIARAAEALHITPQTISGQIKLLEGEMQGPLLEKQGRRAVPTELGLTVFEYAEEIFSVGQDLARVMQGGAPRGLRPLTVGVSDEVPNLVAWRVIAPLMTGANPFRVVCHSGSLDTLVAELATHRFDLVLSSSALSPSSGFRVYSHLLGECDIAFFAATRLAKKLQPGFPRSLHQAPILLPTERSPTRRVFETWFAQQGVAPTVVGEFDDSAMLKTFGQSGLGVFAAPSVIEEEIIRQCKVRLIGRAGTMQARFYALSMERRIRHPALVHITQGARTVLFGEHGGASAKDAGGSKPGRTVRDRARNGRRTS
ncbi:MAG: transcriptional activator NhaR [Gammaproteobacteria bacterium]|nr:transcriptional activator NhaR [Gammaproteobacteria bacterium]